MALLAFIIDDRSSDENLTTFILLVVHYVSHGSMGGKCRP